jgi:DNA-binding NarL/FixJ family response regulator
MHAARPLSVMLVDDHEIVRGGIRALVEAAGGMSVVAEARGVAEAISVARRAEPDVVVMDVRLADGSGIDATREIRARRPATRVVMLTSFSDDEALVASIKAGASGYVLKQVRGGELLHAIRVAGAGGSLYDPLLTESVVNRIRRGKHLVRDERLSRLTPREETVIALIADGCTNREIGGRLELAEKTVKNNVSSILAKLNVMHRSQAAAYLASHTATPEG